MALIGVDIEIPECADQSLIPRSEGGERGIRDDVVQRVWRQRVFFKKFEKREGAVEEEKEDGEERL